MEGLTWASEQGSGSSRQVQVGHNSSLPRYLAAPELLVVMKDSPQPHSPLEFGLINMNSDLLKDKGKPIIAGF